MPARRRTAPTTSSGNISSGDGNGSSSGAASPTQPDDDAYRLKRQRNNDAVKKTREKSKQTAADRKKHVEKLKEENSRLEMKIDAEKESVKLLKELLLHGVKSEDQDRVIREILESPTDDEDDQK